MLHHIYKWTKSWTKTNTNAHIHSFIVVLIYIYMYICLCMCVYVCVSEAMLFVHSIGGCIRLFFTQSTRIIEIFMLNYFVYRWVSKYLWVYTFCMCLHMWVLIKLPDIQHTPTHTSMHTCTHGWKWLKSAYTLNKLACDVV